MGILHNVVRHIKSLCSRKKENRQEDLFTDDHVYRTDVHGCYVELTGTVVLVEPQGSYTLVHVATSEGEFSGRGRLGIARGDRVDVRVYDACHPEYNQVEFAAKAVP